MAQSPDLPISSVAPIVSDLERSTAFYRDVLGLDLAAEGHGFVRFTTPGADLTLWDASLFNEALGFRPGLIDGRCGRTMIACNLASHSHVDEACSRISSHGVGFLKPPTEFEWNAYAAYFLDPDGNFIELFSWMSGGPLDVVTAADAPRFPGHVNDGPLAITSVCLFVADIRRCLEFYRGPLGMTPTRLNLEDGFANFSGQGADFSMWDLKWTERSIGYESAKLVSDYQGTIITCELPSMDAVRDCYQRLKAAGARFCAPPRELPWRRYAAYLPDPENHLWEFYAPSENRRVEPSEMRSLS